MLEHLNFLEYLILVLLGLLFFKEVLLDWLGAKLGFKTKTDDVPPWAGQLMEYFNHDTTGHHEETHRKLDALLETTKANAAKLQEFDRYGVKVRKS